MTCEDVPQGTEKLHFFGINYNYYSYFEIFSTNRFSILSLLSECPKESPTGKCIGNITCEYGEVCCCGKCYTTLEASCVSGRWLSLYTEACQDAHLGCGNKYKP